MTGARGRNLFGWLLQRIGGTILVLFGASLLLFAVLRASPGNQGTTLEIPSASLVTASHHEPPRSPWYVEYATWLASAVYGDFGRSSVLRRGQPVGELLWPAARRSFSLGLASLGLSSALALGLAWLTRATPSSRFGMASEHLLVLLSATPVFLLAYGLVGGGNSLLAWGIGKAYWSVPSWFPLPSRDAWVPWSLAAGILALGDGLLLDLYQRFRSELDHAATAEYLVGARMLGMSIPRVVARAFLPGAVSHVSGRLSFLLGSLVVLESALGWPGLGHLAWRAAAERDTPVLLAIALVLALVVRVGGLASDAVRYAADPRSRLR